MTTASGPTGTASAQRAADPPGQTAEVSWFDTRVISLNGSDLAELDAREKARSAAFVFPADRHRYQVAHVMLRRVLAGHLGTDPSRLTFGRRHCPTCGGPAGKPILIGGQPGDGAWPGVSFSLAHSGEAVAIAVARGPVGIDVEREPSGCVCSLASAMHPDDAAIVEPLPEPERHHAVIRWWVRAEAVLKCAGTGIAHGMDAFPVLGAPVRSRVPAAAGFSFAALSAPKGYQAALALPVVSQQGEGGGPWPLGGVVGPELIEPARFMRWMRAGHRWERSRERSPPSAPITCPPM